jgi:hypothetical protein
MITIPDSVKNRETDTVTYYYQEPGVSEKKEKTYVCYAGHMSKLSNCDFWLCPDKYSAATSNCNCDGDVYLQWISLLKQNNVIPHEVEASVENNKLYMYVPNKNYSKHRVYATLCAYRWAESLARLPYAVVKLCEQHPNLPFWQIWHYACGENIKLIGHSWHHLLITASIKSIYANYGQTFNLANSLAIPLFWLNLSKAGTGYTCRELSVISTAIGPITSQSGYVFPSLLVNGLSNNDQNDVLNPRWSILYKIVVESHQAGKTYSEIKDILKLAYDKIVHNDKSIADLRSSITQR